jgi:L-alanine-DL-glutamate epimerase-like enolase superfamily enzyme
MADAINKLPTAMEFTVVEVVTDEAVSGQCPIHGYALNHALIEGSLKPQAIGEDPLNSERIWEKMYWASLQHGRRGAAISALSAIDTAVWDLKGKILKQPVHRILGGHRDKVASYGSGVDLNYTREELVREMNDYVNTGFRMVKMKVGQKDLLEDLERVKLVRKAIGPDVDLALDVNNGWSFGTAARMARKREEYDIYWREELILADEMDNLVKLARETSIPIAVGENHYTKWEFKELMERGAVEIVQADILKCGGVTEFIKIAAMADAHGLPVCPHHTEYIDAALVASVPNGLFHEYIHEFFQPIGQILIDPISPNNGEISPSSKPGFGIELNEAAIEALKGRPGPAEHTWSVKKGWRWPPYL